LFEEERSWTDSPITADGLQTPQSTN